ncbi:hypothetical protein JHK85_051031 [Glycine max]|nr:hypothetical protein JHK85_051031 [Glycine max]
MEGSIDPATSTLLCLENNDTCFDEFDCNVADESLSWDHKHLNLNNQCLIKDNHGSEHFWDFSVQSDETVMGLVGRESEHLPHVGYLKRLLSGDLDLSVRNEALDWIWKNGTTGVKHIEMANAGFNSIFLPRLLPQEDQLPSEIAAAVAISVSREIQAEEIDKALQMQAEETAAACFFIVGKERILKGLELIKDLSLMQDSANLGNNLASFVPQSPIGVLDAACLSSISDELTVGSYRDSSLDTPNSKRRKSD